MFAWSGGKSLVANFSVFLGVAVLIHLFGFYLFQVVYPVTARVEPVPSRVRILDPTEPAVAALMRQVDDRLIFLRSSAADSEARVSLADFSVEFQPSFVGRDLAYRPIPLAEATREAGQGMEAVLPPLNRTEVMTSSLLRIWRVGGGLAAREVRRPEALDEAIAQFGFRNEDRVRLSLSVDRRGDLRTVRPAEEEAYPRIDELVVLIRTHLRFERETGPPGEEGLEQGWLELGR